MIEEDISWSENTGYRAMVEESICSQEGRKYPIIGITYCRWSKIRSMTVNVLSRRIPKFWRQSRSINETIANRTHNQIGHQRQGDRANHSVQYMKLTYDFSCRLSVSVNPQCTSGSSAFQENPGLDKVHDQVSSSHRWIPINRRLWSCTIRIWLSGHDLSVCKFPIPLSIPAIVRKRSDNAALDEPSWRIFSMEDELIVCLASDLETVKMKKARR